MASISTNTFRMGQKHPIRDGVLLQLIRYQDYTFRDTSRKCRLRKWSVVHNLATDNWVCVKEWTTQLPGEPHYVQAPKKIAIALRMLVDRDFPS